mgnify:FL=1
MIFIMSSLIDGGLQRDGLKHQHPVTSYTQRDLNWMQE